MLGTLKIVRKARELCKFFGYCGFPNTDAIGMVVCPNLDVLVAGFEKSCYAWDIKKLSIGKKDG